MSAWSAMGPGTRGLILGVGAVALAAAGWFGWQASRPASEPEPEGEATEQPAVKPAVEPVAEAAATSTPEVAKEEDPTPEAATAEAKQPGLPKIDVWRVSPEGDAVISGLAEAGSRIEVIVDGVAVAETTAAQSGEFAVLFSLAPNPQPSLMWLSMTKAGGETIASDEMVALGPITGPKVEVAAAEPEALPEESLTVAEEVPATPPALLLTERGAVVLQEENPADPEMRANVMIDTIAYTPDGEVQVGGRAGAGATLRIYLDNTEKVSLRVPETGLWLTTLPDTPPGIYTLRVDQLDESGKVISRFETPFKRETLEALAAAIAPTVDETSAAPVAVAEAVPEDTPVPEAATEGASAAEALAEPAPEPSAPVAIADAPAQNASPAAEVPAPSEDVADIAAESEPGPSPDPAATLEGQPVPEAAPEPKPEVEVAVDSAPHTPRPVTVTVQPGFTLWGIAQERYGDGVMYVQVFDANREKIKDPNLIYPGQVFAMPEPAP